MGVGGPRLFQPHAFYYLGIKIINIYNELVGDGFPKTTTLPSHPRDASKLFLTIYENLL